MKKINIEQALIQRLIEKSEKESLNIEVKFANKSVTPLLYREARAIGKMAKADLVIWGDLYVQCHVDSIRTSLKYVVLNVSNLVIDIEGETGIQSVGSLTEIREGYLQDDIDAILKGL